MDERFRALWMEMVVLVDSLLGFVFMISCKKK